MRPRLLDLFCGAGGAAVGYHRAGFDVVGIDIEPQPNYPFKFWQGAALAALNLVRDGLLSTSFDAIHASPPCQLYSKAWRIRAGEHPDLVEPTRRLLNETGLPWVIENVPGAPLINPVVLEGQMFEGLRTQRKRWFETNWPLDVPFLRSPRPAPQAKMGRKPKPHEWFQVVGNTPDANGARAAMGIDWMNRDELGQAIPPAYCEFIGDQLLAWLRASGRVPADSSPARTLGTAASPGHRTDSPLSTDAPVDSESSAHSHQEGNAATVWSSPRSGTDQDARD